MNQLYFSPVSPFARKVRVAALEKGVADQIEEVEVATSPVDTNPDLAARNPLGKLPCLVRADGRVIYDSRAILRFIDGLTGTATLYPADDSVFDRLTVESLAEGVLDAAVLCVYERRTRSADQVSQAWLDGQAGKINRALDWFEAHVPDALEPDFDAACIGLACALGYLDFRQPTGDWRPGRPQLTAWYETVSGRPSLTQTKPS
ncbi:glutathione S-transferase family protein [Ruegeria sp.]|uniref:glutathione S-transferase family protein n=1 Tax=Ruegeria sp. TaxID=1879320 RepID=UPI00231A1006|nr:glutathione S-transferase family protein [Ruegeria sp.]MDA7964926.1 glutathione S-transferase family protein [Ruegeria sp.]